MPTRNLKTEGNITNNNDDRLVDEDGYVFVSCSKVNQTALQLTGDTATWTVDGNISDDRLEEAYEALSDVDGVSSFTTEADAALFDVEKYEELRIKIVNFIAGQKIHWKHNK